MAGGSSLKRFGFPMKLKRLLKKVELLSVFSTCWFHRSISTKENMLMQFLLCSIDYWIFCVCSLLRKIVIDYLKNIQDLIWIINILNTRVIG